MPASAVRAWSPACGCSIMDDTPVDRSTGLSARRSRAGQDGHRPVSGPLEPAPRLRVTSVTLGTPRPRELARFYARLLGWPVSTEEGPGPGEPAAAGWAQVGPPAGVSGPTLNFEWERHFSRPVWPAEPGRQTASQHLDVEVEDLAAATGWAVSCGATLAGTQPQDGVRVLLDPDGHPFCLFR